MSREAKILMCVLSGLMAGTTARALTSNGDNPYGRIADQNIFHLVPPPPPPTNPPPPLPKISLTGITTILGTKQALLRVQPPGRPGESTKEEAYILAAGQHAGDVEVVEIDEVNGLVKINVDGRDLTLDFANSREKPPILLPQIPPPVSTLQSNPPEAHPLSQEEQELMIEAQRVKAMDEADPMARILPPTSLTAEVVGEHVQ